MLFHPLPITDHVKKPPSDSKSDTASAIAKAGGGSRWKKTAVAFVLKCFLQVLPSLLGVKDYFQGYSSFMCLFTLDNFLEDLQNNSQEFQKADRL